VEGIQFVVDETGRQTTVLIDLERHGELWEDIYDALLLSQRMDDPLETIESVEARLRAQGKLLGPPMSTVLSGEVHYGRENDDE
jgi:hypothetical protein